MKWTLLRGSITSSCSKHRQKRDGEWRKCSDGWLKICRLPSLPLQFHLPVQGNQEELLETCEREKLVLVVIHRAVDVLLPPQFGFVVGFLCDHSKFQGWVHSSAHFFFDFVGI